MPSNSMRIVSGEQWGQASPQHPPCPQLGLAEVEKGEWLYGSCTAAVAVLMLRTVRGNPPPELQGGMVDLTEHQSGGPIRQKKRQTQQTLYKHPNDDQQDSQRVAVLCMERLIIHRFHQRIPLHRREINSHQRQCLIEVNYSLRNALHSSTLAGSFSTEMTRFSGITLE